MDRLELVAACGRLPVFPLPDVVLMPGALLPLHIFEPRYRALVSDCVASSRPLSVCQIEPSEVAGSEGAPAILAYAGIGVISAHRALSDGRSVILINPLGRVHFERELPSRALYRTFAATLLEDVPVDARALGPYGDRIRRLFTPLIGRSEELAAQIGELPAEQVPEALASLVIRTPAGRQDWLAEDNPLHRAALVEEAVLTRLAERRSGAGDA